MTHTKSIFLLPIALLLLSGGALAPAAGARGDDRPPTPEEIRTLVKRVIANQHRNDEALMEYERTEHRQARKKEQDAVLSEDKTFRVVPTGTGVVRVETEENGRAVDAERYRHGLRDVEQALADALNPGQSRQRRAVEKGAKRSRERAELVDAVADAFLFTWQGRENAGSRTLVKLKLDPNPAYHASSRNTSLLASFGGTLWVDETSAQLVRAEARLVRDLSLGGGFLARVHRGGRLVFEQAEIAPGIWLPVRYEYDYDGHKFFFGFQVHEVTEASHYHHIGPPKTALVAIRHELDGNPAKASDP